MKYHLEQDYSALVNSTRNQTCPFDFQILSRDGKPLGISEETVAKLRYGIIVSYATSALSLTSPLP